MLQRLTLDATTLRHSLSNRYSRNYSTLNLKHCRGYNIIATLSTRAALEIEKCILEGSYLGSLEANLVPPDIVV